jgi:predicted transcriptional regulator
MAKEAKTRALTIRFSESDWRQMQALSDLEDVSAATVVRRALRAYVAANSNKKAPVDCGGKGTTVGLAK